MNQITDYMPMQQPLSHGAALNRSGLSPSLGATSAPSWQAPEPTPEIVEIWRAVMQRKWAILSLGLMSAGIAAFVVTQMKPTYQSSATVLLEATAAKVVSQIEDVYSGVSNNREHFQTQAEVMKSRDVALRVIEQLRLTEHPEFDPRQKSRPALSAWITERAPILGALIDDPLQIQDEDAVKESVLREYAKRLTIESVRLSQLVRVRFEANDPSLAAAVANAVGEAYIAQDRANRVAMTAGAGGWIRERMEELKKALDSSERALQTYRDREGLLDSKTTVLGGSGRQMDELTNRLVEAGVRRAMAEEAYKQVKAAEGNNFSSVPAVVRSPSVQNAKAIENELEKKLAEVSERYGPDHPRNVAASSELRSARQNTQREVRTIVDSLVKEYQGALATEKSLEAQLRESKGTIQTLNRKEIQLTALEREAATNRQLYETFLTRSGETSATRDSQQPNARVVDRAVPAIDPIRPNKPMVVTVSFIGGLAIGLLGALLLSRLNNTVRTTSDVEGKLRYPFLSALPVIGVLQRKHASRMVIEYPGDIFSEGVRTASTGVMLSALDSPHKVVAVTSSVPGEGKSTFSLNWATAHSRSKSTVVVEADMRRPTFANNLKLESGAPGLSDVLAGNVSVADALQQIEGSSVRILVAGKPPPDPLDMLSTQRFRDLLLELQREFELVIVDCPPVQLVSDALVIGQSVTGLVYLVLADETPVPLAKTGLKRISEAGIKIIGVVLNQHDFKRAERYYGETYGYGRYGKKSYGYGRA